uniref:OTU-like cysteine protease n=1 Tax=Pithovirus LCPAC101 TaxID=2506586 RepID=A0A481Z2Y8_9VIRU|nr:MAG: OTU-like cysteine protease [Pithovirus LCPAC101]
MDELIDSLDLMYDKEKNIVYGDNAVGNLEITAKDGRPLVRIACAGPKMCLIECVVNANNSDYSREKDYYEKQRFIEQILHEILFYYKTGDDKVGKQLADKLDISLRTLYDKIENREDFDELLLETIASFLFIGVAVYDIESDNIEFIRKSKIYRKRYINIGRSKDRYELLGIDDGEGRIITATLKPIHSI